MRKRLAKLFLMISLAWFATGCAISGTQILAYTEGAVMAAQNTKKVVETIEEIKDIRSGVGEAPRKD